MRTSNRHWIAQVMLIIHKNRLTSCLMVRDIEKKINFFKQTNKVKKEEFEMVSFELSIKNVLEVMYIQVTDRGRFKWNLHLSARGRVGAREFSPHTKSIYGQFFYCHYLHQYIINNQWAGSENHFWKHQKIQKSYYNKWLIISLLDIFQVHLYSLSESSPTLISYPRFTFTWTMLKKYIWKIIPLIL